MPKMTKNQMQGRLAELQISRIFVQSGHSVNEFKDSDFGIDLHVQFLEVCDLDDKDPWELSSNSVYIQVKSSRIGERGGYPSVRVSVASLETWFAGTKVGKPTLVVRVKFNNFLGRSGNSGEDTVDAEILTPDTMERILNEIREGKINTYDEMVDLRYWDKVDVQDIPRIAWIWGQHPAWLMTVWGEYKEYLLCVRNRKFKWGAEGEKLLRERVADMFASAWLFRSDEENESRVLNGRYHEDDRESVEELIWNFFPNSYRCDQLTVNNVKELACNICDEVYESYDDKHGYGLRVTHSSAIGVISPLGRECDDILRDASGILYAMSRYCFPCNG